MTTDVPVYPQPIKQPDPPFNRTRRRWLYAGVAGWAALLLVGSYVSVRVDEPTVREQRSLEQATPIVDRAVVELVAAAGPDVVVEFPEPRVRKGCRITPLRGGGILEREVTIHTGTAEAPALLDRIAEQLPAAYRAGARHSPGGAVHSLRADAGEFVAIKGGVTDPGVVTLTVATGCRPL